MTEHAHRALSPNERRTPLTNTGSTRRPVHHTDPPAPTPPTPATIPTTPAVGPRLPRLGIDTAAVTARYRAVLATTHRAAFRAALVQSVSDVPALVSEVDRLWLALVASRRRYANLLAAARAAVAADRDGDPDPFAYLRDEVDGPAVPVEYRTDRGRW